MLVTGFIKPNRPHLFGIAGGSGSGKTYFANSLRDALGLDVCEIVLQDNFYLDQSEKFDFDGGAVNFDHPEAIDFEKLASCLRELRQGLATEIPIYNFVTHAREQQTKTIQPKAVILVDGILLFHLPVVRAIFDEMIFFDAPEALRFQRRLERDVRERGRTLEGVKAQFFGQVKPMHDQFVEPTKGYAHRIVEDSGSFDELFNEYRQKMAAII
jgi:uridine kinase